MTKVRAKEIEGVITAIRILNVQRSDETIVQATVRMSDEYCIRPEEVEEVLAAMDGKKIDKKVEDKKAA